MLSRAAMTIVEQYLSLAIELSTQHVSWLAARLGELGFSAFEEQACEAGTRIIVYDPSEERLTFVRERLLALARELPVGALLGFELGQAGSDWMLAWTEHLRPVELTERLTLFPYAPERAPVAGELYLRPAFAFGFGEHPSTRLCARWLERTCGERAGCSVLDVGCGTGVLALVAHLSGARRVLGVDVSEAAVEAARVNAVQNGAPEVSFECAAVADIRERFDCVVANIEANVLLGLCDGIVGTLGPGGELALSGFILEQCEAVIHAYREAGVLLELREQADDWCLLVGRAVAFRGD